MAALLAAAGIPVGARLTVQSALRTMPFETSAPVDPVVMAKVLDQRVPGHAETTVLGGEARLVSLDSLSGKLQTGKGRTLDLHLLPAAKDTLIALIETIDSPQPDSRLSVFDRNWKLKWKFAPTAPQSAPEGSVMFGEMVYTPASAALTVDWREAGNDSITAREQYVLTPKGVKRAKK